MELCFVNSKWWQLSVHNRNDFSDIKCLWITLYRSFSYKDDNQVMKTRTAIPFSCLWARPQRNFSYIRIWKHVISNIHICFCGLRTRTCFINCLISFLPSSWKTYKELFRSHWKRLIPFILYNITFILYYG